MTRAQTASHLIQSVDSPLALSLSLCACLSLERTVHSNRIVSHGLASEKDASTNELECCRAALLVHLTIHQLERRVESHKVQRALARSFRNEHSTPAHCLRALRLSGRRLERLARAFGESLERPRDVDGLRVASDRDARSSELHRDRRLWELAQSGGWVDGIAVGDARRQQAPHDRIRGALRREALAHLFAWRLGEENCFVRDRSIDQEIE